MVREGRRGRLRYEGKRRGELLSEPGEGSSATGELEELNSSEVAGKSVMLMLLPDSFVPERFFFFRSMFNIGLSAKSLSKETALPEVLRLRAAAM